jgi:hypothetical protein
MIVGYQGYRYQRDRITNLTLVIVEELLGSSYKDIPVIQSVKFDFQIFMIYFVAH